MRVPLPVSLESRDGTTTRDAKVVNGIIESKGQDSPPILIKRPGVSDVGQIHNASSQLLYNWNGVKAILGDSIYSGTPSGIIGSSGTALSPTNAGLQFTAAETNQNAVTPRLMFKNRSQAWTIDRSGTVSTVTYPDSMGAATYTLLSLVRVSTTATATLTNDPGFDVGDTVTIAGATPIDYNGAQTITAVTASTHTPARVLPITSLTRVSTTATAICTAHGLTNGNTYTVSGANQSAYNGAFTVTVLDANTFTYVVTLSGSGPDNDIPITITRIGTTATAASSSPHGLSSGTQTISGATQSEYNGSKSITVTDTTHFTYTVTVTPASPVTPATGSPTISSWSIGYVSLSVPTSSSTVMTVKPGEGQVFNMVNGDSITLTGAGAPAWNGTFTVANASSSSLTVTVAAGTSGDSSAVLTRTAPAVSSITRAGTVGTLTTSSAHKIQVNDTVTVSGTGQAEYNTGFTVTSVPNNTSITFYVNVTGESPVSPATGTIIVAGKTPASPATGTITVTVPAVDINVTFSFVIGGAVTTPATGTITVQGSGGTVPGIPYIDGYFNVMDINGVIWSSNQDDPTTWGALSSIIARNENGGGKALGKSLNYLIAFKEYSTEYFFDNQNATGSPFSAVDNGFIRVGCASGDSVAQVGNSLCWVSQLRAGSRSVWRIDGLQPQEIGTPDACRIINTDDLVTVYAYGLEMKGHLLYLITLKDSNITLVYDMTSNFWLAWSSLTAGSAKSISTIVRSGDTATATFAVPHTLSDGDPVLIAGAGQTQYNGIVQAMYVDPNTISYIVNGEPATPASSMSFATLNPADKGSAVTLSGGNLSASIVNTNCMVRATQGVSAGKWYWEVTITGSGGASYAPTVGVAKSTATLNNYLGEDADGWSYYGKNGDSINSTTQTAYGATYTTNDVIGIALDADHGTLTFYKNGVSQGSAFIGLSGTFYPAVSGDATANTVTVTCNFGASAFAYSVPTGYNSGVFTSGISGTPYTESYFKFSKAMNYNGSVYFLHESNGHLYQMNEMLYQDAGAPIDLMIRTVRLDGGDDSKKKMPYLRFISDEIPDTGMVRYSDDDCQTFSSFRPVDLSLSKPEIRKLKAFRRRNIEFRYAGNNPLRAEALELGVGK